MSGLVVGALRGAAGAGCGGAAGCICCSSCFIRTESTAVESRCAKRSSGIQIQANKMKVNFFTEPSIHWLNAAGFFPEVSYAMVRRTGGARRENDVKRRKECVGEKINGWINVSSVEFSREYGEETKRALPAKNEQMEHVSACEASMCLQFAASA